MKLRNVERIVQFGHWMADRGFAVGEGPDPFGPVTPGVHTPTSLHYRGLAYDVNFGASGHDENARLESLYRRILRHRTEHPDFPLDEMFFNGLGFMKEYGPRVNHPISGHDTHLHVGFTRKSWPS